jgi:effector-binding domain-containing protein
VTTLHAALRRTAAVPATTTWAEFPTLWRSLLDQVWAVLRSDPAIAHGHNIFLYLDATPRVEIGVELFGTFQRKGNVVESTVPGGEVATTTSRGYDGLGEAHRAVRGWCAENGRTLAGPFWEIYGDPDEATGAVSIEVCYLLT